MDLNMMFDLDMFFSSANCIKLEVANATIKKGGFPPFFNGTSSKSCIYDRLDLYKLPRLWGEQRLKAVGRQ
jgi:hypothetical protein